MLVLTATPMNHGKLRLGMGTDMAEMNFMQRSRMHGYRSNRLHRRASLIDEAKLDRIHAEDSLRQAAHQHRLKLLEEQASLHHVLEKVSDDGIELLNAAVAGVQHKYILIIQSSETIANVINIVTTLLQKQNIKIEHLETRENKEEKENEKDKERKYFAVDLLIKVEADKDALLRMAVDVDINTSITCLKIMDNSDTEANVVWFPKHISELDLCTNYVIKYEPEIDDRHPAFGDEDYIERRKMFAKLAAEHTLGAPIIRIDYTEGEKQTWKEVYTKMRELRSKYACKEYLTSIEALERETSFGPDNIPQLEDLSQYLQRKTGFRLRPAGGLLSARDFLASLAFRVFQATQYVRHTSAPHYTPEPDVVHELLGHVPMFADPAVAQFSQEIGLASLGSSDKDIEKLSTLYWFTIEFGLCKEDGQLKACGAGLLSAYGELLHAISSAPEHRAFEPETTALVEYTDDDYQPVYFVSDTIQDAMNKLRSWACGMNRPFTVLYDAYTDSVHKINAPADLLLHMHRLRSDITQMQTAIHAIANKDNK